MMLNSTSLLFAAAIQLAAGLYPLTPAKQACLRHCRGPIPFLIGHWRPGRAPWFPAGDTLCKVTGGLLVLWGVAFLYQAMA